MLPCKHESGMSAEACALAERAGACAPVAPLSPTPHPFGGGDCAADHPYGADWGRPFCYQSRISEGTSVVPSEEPKTKCMDLIAILLR